MVYYGYTPDEKQPSAEAIDLLKLALRNVPIDQPYRGPNRLELGNLVYECSPSGTLGCFEGETQSTHGGCDSWRAVLEMGEI
jgi:hypothetical protein